VAYQAQQRQPRRLGAAQPELLGGEPGALRQQRLPMEVDEGFQQRALIPDRRQIDAGALRGGPRHRV
jgi:hypothetical protein